MKKYISAVSMLVSMLAAGVILVGCLAGCGSGSGQTVSIAQNSQNSKVAQNAQTDDKVRIVTTIFPEYDWVREILGENSQNAELTLLLDNGVDLHSYQPTAADILKIATCDLFIYVGGESDEWVEDALEEATNKDMIVINLLETLGEGAKEEELVEVMETEHDHENGDPGEEVHAGGGHEESEEEIEYDEHVWLSLKNATVFCDAITDALVRIDAQNAESYKANAEKYKSELESLDVEYQSAVAEGTQKTVLFGDRFPFRYLTDDYGLSYYAAFVGCSAETEASFETIVFLANKADELEIPAIMKIESSDGKIAETIRNNTTAKNQKILTMDSMQSTTSKNIAEGVSYMGIMRENLAVLKEGLQ